MSDYATVKASRSLEFSKHLAIHESSHCVVSKGLGNFVDLLSLVPNGVFVGYCMRRGAPLGFVDESAAVEPAPECANDLTVTSIVDLCEKIGPPVIGEPRVENAAGITRAMINIVELVAGRVGEKIFFPDNEPIPAALDFVEARAFASIMCSSPASVAALLRWAEAEAEALIRQHMTAVSMLADELVERGELLTEQIDQIIGAAVDVDKLKIEHARRKEMKARTDRAGKFKELIANG